MMSYYHSIAYFEFRHRTPDIDHLAGNLVTQDGGLFQLLKADLVHIRETNPACLDSKQEIALLKRRSRNLLDSCLMVLRNDGFHQVQTERIDGINWIGLVIP